ncbi:MAG: 16S rRNA (cytidine(1402)-2'-O)-methyltransferase [Myxococcota bacterium]
MSRRSCARPAIDGTSRVPGLNWVKASTTAPSKMSWPRAYHQMGPTMASPVGSERDIGWAMSEHEETSPLAPGLYVVGTPLGNLEDITLRALRVLRSVDVMACEDTRRTWKLLNHFEIPRPSHFFAAHDHNEARVASRILGFLEAGVPVALVSDAGMPLISDPGFVVSRAAREADHPVHIIPGPTAAVTGLVASGLPVHSFLFKGFPPRKSGQRTRFFEEELMNPATLIVYASPHRIGSVLNTAAAVFGDRPAALCVELTKKFEQIERGGLLSLAARFAEKAPKGELTLLIHGYHKKHHQGWLSARDVTDAPG